MKYYISICLLGLLFGCQNSENVTSTINDHTVVSADESSKPVDQPKLNLEQANRLAELPLACVNTEYPNKLGQTLGSDDDLRSPQDLHPTFYGCFDWHSAVHGHWSLVSLMRQFQNL